MSDTSAFGFGQFVPGFDFLQNLAKSASSATQAGGSALPGLSNWVAPTLSVEELDKRIQELKAVLFWLEQNGTALKATIQALEVQKMTLSTLQGMNVNMAELAKAFTAKVPEPAAPAASAPPAPPLQPTFAPPPAPMPASPLAASAAAETAAPPEASAQSGARAKGRRGPQPASAASAVDPMQWWGSLTQQFQNIATAAMQDVAAQALKDKAAVAAGKTSAGGGAAPPKPARRSSAAGKRAGPAPGPKARTRKTAAAKTRSPRP